MGYGRILCMPPTLADGSDADAARELLRDAFTRLIEHVENITENLDDETSEYRPAGTANSIA